MCLCLLRFLAAFFSHGVVSILQAAVCTVSIHQREYAAKVARLLAKHVTSDKNEKNDDAVLLDTRRLPLNAKIK